MPIMFASTKSELAERGESISAISVVNGCGDEFTNVPEHFEGEISSASTKAAVVMTIFSIQLILTFGLCGYCWAGAKVRDFDDHFIRTKNNPEGKLTVYGVINEE